MRSRLNALLKNEGPQKARELAKKLGVERSELNAYLYQNSETYRKDDDHRWTLSVFQDAVVKLPAGWLQAERFEQILFSEYPRELPRALTIAFDGGCKLMFDCIARVLAVVNQSVGQRVETTLDFRECAQIRSFLDRAGFFDQLDSEVIVLPQRPRRSAAEAHKGQSDTLVEIASVKLDGDNSELVEDLCHKFVLQSSEAYMSAAATMFGELINNVREHSEATRGFAGFQKYSGHRPHIQTVVSDNGVGIAATLRTTLRQHHSHLFRRYGKQSVDADVGLLTSAVRDGQVSRFGKGRGLGLSSSHRQTKRFNAAFSVRQRDFALRFAYSNGQLAPPTQQLGLVPLCGTHICFDFYLD